MITDKVLALSTGIAVVGGAVFALAKGVRWVFSNLRKFSEFLEDWRGEEARPGHAYQPGVPERFSKLEDRLVAVEKEVNRISLKIDNS